MTNEFILHSASTWKTCMMPSHHNEHFSVSLTTRHFQSDSFRRGMFAVKTHVYPPTHTTTLSISFTAYTCKQLGFLLGSTVSFQGPDPPRQRGKITRKVQFFKPMHVISFHSRQLCLSSIWLINAPQALREFWFPPGKPSQGKSPQFYQAGRGSGTSSDDLLTSSPEKRAPLGRHLAGPRKKHHRRKVLLASGSTIAMGSGKKSTCSP